MSDALLTDADQKEALSRVYARAIAARAGYTASDPDFDRDSVDIRINAGGKMRPSLDLQLKATTTLGEPVDGHYRFHLKPKNYDDLIVDTQVPRLLVVLDLPRDKDRWMNLSAERLILRRRALWISLNGFEKSSNRFSVTVRIPAVNLFTIDSLRDLMEQSRRGEIQ